ncbi:integrase [Nitrobacter vulgaris]|uniref:tyrosine-type recombinase/integrase n=1 Tax=Nitrobacter vulgaris TaxID=29421 RepID=UPI002867608D|nr:integrase arm-type DNA-binding domain-containing protein [Nitrobacter vulgaris]MDR6303071.1 integrase [Nitrobacter vulgaris]
MAKRQLHRLTARQAETISKPGRHGDGGNLFLVIGAGAARSWCFIYRDADTGRLRELGLGPAKGVRKHGLTLAQAREKAAAMRQLRLGGLDPIAHCKAEKTQAVTFGPFALELLESIKGGFRNPKTASEWRRGFEVHAKALAAKRLNAIDTAEVLSVLKPLWLVKPKTARELRGRIERVLDAAKVKGLRTGSNPAAWKGHLSELLPVQSRRKQHHAAAAYDAVPEIMDKIRADTSTLARLLEFNVLTCVRAEEARAARVYEIDFEAKTWTIPADRTKMGRDHVVPLVGRAIEILKAVIHKDAQPNMFVFAGRSGEKPIGKDRATNLLREIAPGATLHGMRSSFRDWCGDKTGFSREVAEATLAHAIGNQVEQAYRRSDALEKRRALMNAWDAWCAGIPESDNVVPFQIN